MSSTSCTIPTATLRAAPFNLPWGSSIYAKVYATNLYGNSFVSNVGNGAIILTKPDAPNTLANVPAQTSASQISITWLKGAAEGGTPVIDYSVWFDQGNGNYIIFQSGVLPTSYITTALTMGTSYKFKVKARNAFGFSDFSNEVTILQAEKPLKPADPVTSVLTDVSVVVSWTAPSSQGSPITSYLV